MERIYNKLVRDKIPEIIEKNGEKAIISYLDDAEYKKELEKKLLEEYKEVIASSGKERIEELADMLEVIKYLSKLENSSLNEIIKISEEKNIKRGSFEKKIFLKKIL